MRIGLTLVMIAAVVASCGWRGLNSLPLPGTQGNGPGSFAVQAQLPDVNNIQPNSRVRVADVTVFPDLQIFSIEQPVPIDCVHPLNELAGHRGPSCLAMVMPLLAGAYAPVGVKSGSRSLGISAVLLVIDGLSWRAPAL